MALYGRYGRPTGVPITADAGCTARATATIQALTKTAVAWQSERRAQLRALADDARTGRVQYAPLKVASTERPVADTTFGTDVAVRCENRWDGLDELDCRFTANAFELAVRIAREPRTFAAYQYHFEGP